MFVIWLADRGVNVWIAGWVAAYATAPTTTSATSPIASRGVRRSSFRPCIRASLVRHPTGEPRRACVVRRTPDPPDERAAELHLPWRGS